MGGRGAEGCGSRLGRARKLGELGYGVADWDPVQRNSLQDRVAREPESDFLRAAKSQSLLSATARSSSRMARCAAVIPSLARIVSIPSLIPRNAPSITPFSGSHMKRTLDSCLPRIRFLKSMVICARRGSSYSFKPSLSNPSREQCAGKSEVRDRAGYFPGLSGDDKQGTFAATGHAGERAPHTRCCEEDLQGAQNVVGTSFHRLFTLPSKGTPAQCSRASSVASSTSDGSSLKPTAPRRAYRPATAPA